MGLDIKRYQEAYERVVNELKNNSRVVAIIVYGSIVSGDIWEKSDIDFLVLTNERDKAESIYTRVSGIPIHINYLSKDIFVKSCQNLLKGGTFHKAFFTGKLVFSRDGYLDDVYLSTRFYGDRDRSIRNVEILCNLLNGMHYTEKYYITGKLETSYQWCMELLKNYARLLMNINGHITDNDILSYAVNMNDEVKYLFNVLTGSNSLDVRIKEVLEFVNRFLQINLRTIAMPVIEFLKERKTAVSIGDMKNSGWFKHVDGDLSLLMDELSNHGIINEGTRKYTTYGDEHLINEIVYSIK
ncbi:nucleotidyltransferase domain-containing protein [Fonticella tunisiensis]|uniref:Polymerase beta nucleotidyltransferase domain-containing protein n=1 Tax=Fonticella tunisiensis TaxID=1096341 RepID=A0A4R7K8H5_9CLOT|nr:nucleotidyltransferase domain-containing protein [Fonticella tunisiensis]TDT47637.1 hypothetical protein EDD71_13423 [Fonticella tunisiensis]